MPNDDLIIQALGGKPGDKLIRNPDGSATLQPGEPLQESPQLTNAVQGGFGATNPAPIAGPDTDPNRVIRQLGMQSAGQRVVGPGEATLLGASDAALPAMAAIGTGLGVAALAPESAIAGLAAIPLSIGAGMAASYGQQAMYSDAHKQLLAEARRQQPMATTAGSLVPSLVTGKPTLDPWRSAGRLARNATRTSIPLALREGMAAGDVANTAGLGAGLVMPGISAYKEYKDTGTIHPGSLAMDVAAGALLGDLNNPTKRGINRVAGRQLAHIGPGYKPQGRELLRKGLDAQAPLNVDTTVAGPHDIPLAEGVSPDAAELGYTEPDKLAADMAKGHEDVVEARRKVDRQSEKVRMQRDAADRAREKAAMKELEAKAMEEYKAAQAAGDIAKAKQAEDIINWVQETTVRVPGAEVGFGATSPLRQGTQPAKTGIPDNPMIIGQVEAKQKEQIKLATEQLREQQADEITNPPVQQKQAKPAKPYFVNQLPADATKIPGRFEHRDYSNYSKPRKAPVPDSPATVAEQVNLTANPTSTRRAVLYTPGTKVPPVMLGLKRVETPHGLVDYNPAKISEQEVLAAANRPDFDARVLGMSQAAKPGDPEAVAVTTSRGGQPNVQAEAAAGEGIPGAVAAAEKANPGGQVEIKTPQQVLDERTSPTPEERKIYQQELDEANRSEGGYGEKEISAMVGDKRPQLLGGISHALEAGGTKVDVIPTDKPYTTADEPTLRYGRQFGNKVDYGTSAHAAPHEAVHAIYEGLPESERGRLDDIIARSEEYGVAASQDPELTPKEFLAQRGAISLVKQIQEKDFGLWKDLAMQARRLFNMETPQDAMRFVANAFSAGADRPGGALNVASPKPAPRPVGKAGTYRRFPESESNQESPIPKASPDPKADAPQTDAEANFSKAEGVFATELEKQAHTAKPWGLLPNNAGKYSAEGLIAKFRMQGKVEQSLLPRFEEWVKSRGGATKEELIQYAKDNEPKAEVHTYGMDREQSDAKKELDKLTHEWYDNLDAGMRYDLDKYRRYEEDPSDVWLSTADKQYGAGTAAKVERYLHLAKTYSSEIDNTPTATHYYNSISPRPVDRPMPDWTASKSKRNLQRVDVVLPTEIKKGWKPYTENGKQYVGLPDEEIVKWHQDDLHENLPNTLGWAAIQYETGPNGERIAHIIEAQSRWGQMARKARGTSHMETGEISDHPLLNDYNRLILKAAIEQARKEGATHVAISDAETAMMTEMHDQVAMQNYRGGFGSKEAAENYLKLGEFDRSQEYYIDKLGDTWAILQRPEQEPGMRFNYDAGKGQLHRAMSELTKDKGTSIDFGNHKNAFNGIESADLQGNPWPPDRPLDPTQMLPEGRPRKRDNLIFKNPDGTPKTTATGVMYNIAEPAARRTAGEPFTYGRANYSKPKLPKDFQASDVRGFDLVSRIDDPALRQSANEAQTEKSRLLGYGYKAVRDNKDNLKAANLDAMVDAYNNKTPLTDTASRAVYKMFADAADWINSNNPARQIIKKLGYVPQMFHPDVRQVFKESPNSAEAKAIKNVLVAHYQKGMARADAVKAVDDLAQAIHTNPSYDPSTDFGPLHKAAGLGLPAEAVTPSGPIRIRDNDMMRVAQTYFGRAATDLAYHNAITTRFGETGGENSNEAFQRWRKTFTGQPESDSDQLLRSSMRAGSSVVVSTLSGLNNLMSIPQQAMAFTGKYGPFTTAAALLDTIKAPIASHEASIAAGHTRPGQNDMTFKQTRDTNVGAAVLDAAADTVRLVTGSTALENTSRAWSYNIGKRAARNMIEAGDHDKMFRLGVQPADPKAEEKLAASIAGHIEGTYDGRELPGWLLEGKMGTLLSIHKWSVEKMNSAYKDLYVPATKGDLWPLVWTAAMAAGVTIPAGFALKEAVNRKKGPAELPEIEAAEKITGHKDWMARAAWLTQLLSMASVAGYASQAANAMTQTVAGRKDQNLVFVPLSELAGEELSTLVSNATAALRKGEDLDTLGPQFGKDLLKILVQASPAVLNRMDDERNVQAASDNRDLAVYNNLVNKKTPSDARANDMDGVLEREFKKEQDPAKARELLEKIVARYKEKYKGDPFMLNAKIRSLREMNGIGWPTEGNEAFRYKQYSDAAYGEEATKEKITRAAYRDALNQGKVKAMDEAGIKPAKAEPNPFRQ